jgi:hypothetical protein
LIRILGVGCHVIVVDHNLPIVKSGIVRFFAVGMDFFPSLGKKSDSEFVPGLRSLRTGGNPHPGRNTEPRFANL